MNYEFLDNGYLDRRVTSLRPLSDFLVFVTKHLSRSYLTTFISTQTTSSSRLCFSLERSIVEWVWVFISGSLTFLTKQLQTSCNYYETKRSLEKGVPLTVRTVRRSNECWDEDDPTVLGFHSNLCISPIRRGLVRFFSPGKLSVICKYLRYIRTVYHSRVIYDRSQ